MNQDLGSMQTTINPADNQDKKPVRQRLRSLDTFRGYVCLIQSQNNEFGTPAFDCVAKSLKSCLANNVRINFLF